MSVRGCVRRGAGAALRPASPRTSILGVKAPQAGRRAASWGILACSRAPQGGAWAATGPGQDLVSEPHLTPAPGAKGGLGRAGAGFHTLPVPSVGGSLSDPLRSPQPALVPWSSSFLNSLGLKDELEWTRACAIRVGVSPLDIRVLPQTKLITNSIHPPGAELS